MYWLKIPVRKTYLPKGLELSFSDKEMTPWGGRNGGNSSNSISDGGGD